MRFWDYSFGDFTDIYIDEKVKMKSIYVTFTDREWKNLQVSRAMKGWTWKQIILSTIKNFKVIKIKKKKKK